MTQVRFLEHAELAVPSVCRESKYGWNIYLFAGREGESLEDEDV